MSLWDHLRAFWPYIPVIGAEKLGLITKWQAIAVATAIIIAILWRGHDTTS